MNFQPTVRDKAAAELQEICNQPHTKALDEQARFIQEHISGNPQTVEKTPLFHLETDSDDFDIWKTQCANH